MRSVYIDTTIPSYYFDDREELSLHIKITRNWWKTEKDNYDLYVSELVMEELNTGEYPAKQDIIQLVNDIPRLKLVSEIEAIVEAYISNFLMPTIDLGDAFHLAFTSYYKIDFLLTWNCNHLANANKKSHIRIINSKLGLHVPEIITPLELVTERSE